MSRRRIICLFILVIVGAVVAVNLTVARLPPMPAARGLFIELDGRNIHYVEQSGTGPPVVMLHGLPGTLYDFDPVVAKMPGRRVITLDRPGFGWSTGGWMPFQQQVDLIHDFLREVVRGPAIVVGHSFGGTLALGLARRYPRDVERMVLLAPGAGGDRQDSGGRMQARYILFSHLPVGKQLIEYTFGNIALRLSAHFGVQHAFSPEPVDAGYSERLQAVSLQAANAEALAREQLQYNDIGQWIDDNVPLIAVPTAVIGAQGDELVPYDRVRRLVDSLPGSRLVTVDGGHMIPYSHPDIVVEQLAPVLSR